MPTLLDSVNELLLNVGEQQVANLSGTVARKAALSVQRAIRFVANLHNWTFLNTVISTANWVNENAVLPPLQEVFAVSLDQYVLRSIAYDTLYEQDIRNNSAIGVPLYFSRTASGVAVYPEPRTLDKPRVQFRVALAPTVPIVGGDNFTLPPDVYDAVMTYAEVLMHRNHTTDMGAMQACASDFELRIHMLRSRYSSQRTANMGMLT